MRRPTTSALRGRLRSCGVALASGALASAVLAAPAMPAATGATGTVAVAAAAAPGSYTPPAGVRVNNPLGDRASRRAILDHIIKSVRSVPGGEQIRIASWNLRSDALVDALVAAHRRGVSVQVVVDQLNANADNYNGSVERLEQQLEANTARDSGVRRCRSACRGQRGIAHTKFFLFSLAGTARWVAMYGSANATDLSATHQWNDLYTVHGREDVHTEFSTVFDEMYRDQPVASPGRYRTKTFGALTTEFYPYQGANAPGDPVLRALGRTACSGATGGTGTDGRTRIRIAMTSWHGARGIDIAQRVRQMYNRGCNIKIVYAVMGNEVLRILRRGGARPVPLRQIVQDFNRDGVYDRYLHMKTMTISGVHGGRSNAEVTYNGSANWTPVAMASDEAGGRIEGRGVRLRYDRWVDRLFARPPYNAGGSSGTAEARVMAGSTSTDTSSGTLTPAQVERIALARGVDPYALIQE